MQVLVAVAQFTTGYVLLLRWAVGQMSALRPAKVFAELVTNFILGHVRVVVSCFPLPLPVAGPLIL